MRNIIAGLVVTLASVSCLASQLPNALLQRDFNLGGFVPEENQEQTVCRVYGKGHPIYSGVVVINTRKGPQLTVQPPRTRAIRWTVDVPNEKTIVELTDEAKKEDGNKQKISMPTDVPAIRHMAIGTMGAGAPKYWVLRSQASAEGEENPSKAAKKLVKFLDLNCR